MQIDIIVYDVELISEPRFKRFFAPSRTSDPILSSFPIVSEMVNIDLI